MLAPARPDLPTPKHAARRVAGRAVLLACCMALTLLALSLTSCYVESGPGYVGAGFMPPRPDGPPDHYVWVPAGPDNPEGYWTYVGPPRPGWAWVPAHRRPDGSWAPGHWRRQ
ncbi:MAG: hypothetical protein LDL30_14560 [Desulfovibrio sp.]|nr:hypothetical protein [Desulfovibrio sp.]